MPALCSWRNPRLLLLLLATLLASIAPATTSSSAPTPCDYYASPNGGGDGLTNSRPFRIQDFWATGTPGKTLCLLDGVYQGAANMIVPPVGKSGASTAPITVRALNDGGVFIDGQFARIPLIVQGQSYWTFQGFDVGNSSNSVVDLSSASNLIFRRICASNASMSASNEHVWLVGSGNSLFEDICG